MAAAIDVTGVSKSFRIPHEQRIFFKEYFLHPFRRTTYERNNALQDVTFTVEAGEFFGVFGPNGSGKSTLLRILAGIYVPDKGRVRVNGLLSPFIELGVGFNLELNARDNIRMNGTLAGLSKRQLDEKFDEILEFSELERFVDQQLKNYSSGMLVRLAYSIAIQIPFDVLLLDEVLAVGDESFQEKCFATFEGFKEDGKTVVLVTHNLHLLSRFCALDRFPAVQDAIGQLPRRDARRRYERWIAAYDVVGEADLSAMRAELSRFAEPRLLSLVVPLTHASDVVLEAFAQSLFAQVYERWEVNFVSTLPIDEHLATSLAQLSSRDRRFGPLPEAAGSVADAWNAALRSSATEFAVVVDPRVSLRPHALYLFASTIERDPDAVLIYGDEDVIDESGSRSDHYFKPEWNAALLRSQNYLGDLVCFRRSRALAVGGCQEEPDG